FLGPGPWQIGSADPRAMSVAGLGQLLYITVEDPRDVYHNVIISLDRAKDINNGQPGSLGRWRDALALRPGARGYQRGCGAGYYSGECYDRAGSDDEDCSVERKVCGRTGFAGGNLLRREPARRRSGTAAAKGFDDGKVVEGEIREAGCASCGRNVRGTRAGSLLESSGSELSV